MELCLVSGIQDAIAIKTPFCLSCAEKKLNVEIIKRWPLSPEEFTKINRQKAETWNFEKGRLETVSVYLRGVTIKCECK